MKIVSTQFFRYTFDINIFNLRFNPTTLNTVKCTVLFQRHLIFLDIHILDIFVDTLYSCVLVAYLDMPFNYSTITGGLYNLPRCCDLYSAVVLKRIAHCIVI